MTSGTAPGFLRTGKIRQCSLTKVPSLSRTRTAIFFFSSFSMSGGFHLVCAVPRQPLLENV